MMKTITIHFMGPARQFLDSPSLAIEVEENAKIFDLRRKIQYWLSDQGKGEKEKAILASSVFATDTEMLSERDSIRDIAECILIPPVSGG